MAHIESAPQAFASDGSDGVGFIAFWGNSPARDLAGDKTMIPDHILAAETAVEEPLNILLSGACDLRHVLSTIAHAQRTQSKRPIHFYLHDNSVETLARHVLFLYLLTDQRMPARERAEVFLSLYGNTLVRERDETYLNDAVAEILNIISGQSEHAVSRLIDFSTLKYKDRDEMAEMVQGWLTKHPFDIETLREQRLRGYYRSRYDYRVNLMDWDYHNGIKNGVAPIIHWQHFKEFGKSGVAFETRLGVYKQPNRTLASYQQARSKTKGTTIAVRGFWGDILNPPYMAFGIEADPQDHPRLFKFANDQYRNNAADIAVFNVQALLQEIDTGFALHLPAESEKESTFPYESPLERIEKVQEVWEEDKTAGPMPLAEAYSRVRVALMTGDVNDMLKKSKFKQRFARAFFGNLAVATLFRDAGLMDEDSNPVRGTDLMKPFPPEDFGSKAGASAIAGSLADGAVVIIESFKYQCHFDGKAKLGYRHRVAETAHRLGWGLRKPRTAYPRLEPDMKDIRARELDAQADPFLIFCAKEEAEPLPAGEPIDLSVDDDEPSTADGTVDADADLTELE